MEMWRYVFWCDAASSQYIEDYPEACSALPTFELTLIGGDGDIVQKCRSLWETHASR
jgi:hypothetical protein